MDPYADIADIDPSQAPPSGYAPGAVFTDTGQPGTGAQIAAYQTLAQTGGYDPSQAPGSIRNPYGLRPGASIPEGAWYVDTHGGAYQAGQGGVQIPAAAQSLPGASQGGNTVPAATTIAPANASPPAAPGGDASSPDPYSGFSDVAPPAGAGSQAGGDPYAGIADVAQDWKGDFARSIPTGVTHAATGVLGMFGNIRDMTDAGVFGAANLIRRLAGYAPVAPASGLTGNALYDFAPASAALNQGIENVTGPLYRPQGPAGRTVDTALSMMPAAIFGPEALGARAASVLAPVAGASLAGEGVRAIGHPEWDGAARLAGGLAGGLGVGAAYSAPGSAKVLASAAGGLNDSDIASAQRIRDLAAGVGVNTTLPEAVQRATLKGMPLLQAQQVVESQPSGSAAMAPLIAARAAQNQAAVDQFIRRVASGPTTPSVVAPQAQAAAEGALTAERQAINARASPLYAASRADNIAPGDYATLQADPVYQRALAQLRQDPELGAPVADLADNTAGVVDQVARRLATGAAQARGSEVLPGDMQLAAIRDNAANQAYRIAAASSPTYGAARAMVAQGRAATLDGLTAGPLGAISGSTSLPEQTGALFPPQPFPGQAADTAETLSRMGSIDPTAPGNLVGAHLGRAAAEAFADTTNGPDLYSGANWALNTAGNPLQSQNLTGAVSTTAGQGAADDFGALRDGLMATGTRLPPKQASDAELLAKLRSHSTNAGEFGVSMFVPAEALHSPLGGAAYPAMKAAMKGIDVINRIRAANNAAALARSLSSNEPIAATVGGARQAVQRGQAVTQAALAAPVLALANKR